MPHALTNSAAMQQVQVRYFASAADASGCSGEMITLRVGSVIDDLRRELIGRHGDRMEGILKVAAYLVGGELTRDVTTVVPRTIEIMPPFAGG